MKLTWCYTSLAMLLGSAWFIEEIRSTVGDTRVWVTGFEKVKESCLPIGGLANPDELPFPFETIDECEKDTFSSKFNNNLQRWEGFVLDNGKCFKVWARSVSNPFSLTSEAKCEQEMKEMKTALVAVEGRGKMKRVSTDALTVGKFALELMFTALTFADPLFVLFIPFLNYLWPTSSSTDAWKKERATVRKMINQKMNEAYATELEEFLKDLKREMNNYRNLPAKSPHKATKLVALDTSLGLEESKFMNRKDPISTLTYYTTYVTTRLVVIRELIQVTKPIEKQQHVREFLSFAKRHIIFLGQIAYDIFPKWRKSKVKCWEQVQQIRYSRFYHYVWEDEKTGARRRISKDDARKSLQAWCKPFTDPILRQMNAYIDTTMRQNIKAWASMFNKMATSPFVSGFSAVDSKMTVDGIPCKLPFYYQGKNVKCTKKGHHRPWCYTDNKNWGNCFSVDSLVDKVVTEVGKACKIPFTYKNVVYNKCTSVGSTKPWCYTTDGKWGYCSAFDLDLCLMPTTYKEQYFGHRNRGDNGQLCNSWKKQTTYTSSYFPMDDNTVELASNYCRRLKTSNSKTWCYTGNSWSYCTIRACGPKDWE